MKSLVLCGAAAVMLSCGVAHADIGGNINGPGLCDYPGVGISFSFYPLLGEGAGYFCRFPREINGSFWVQAYGAYTIGGGAQGTGGIFSAVLGVGGGGGKTGFYCLDNPNDPISFINARRSADPNPPGAWKNAIKQFDTCKPLDDELNDQPNPDTPQPPDDHATAAPTNPGNPNPLATQNPPKR